MALLRQRTDGSNLTTWALPSRPRSGGPFGPSPRLPRSLTPVERGENEEVQDEVQEEVQEEVPPARRLVSLVIGDAVAVWRSAGFAVCQRTDGTGVVEVGGIRIRLVGGGAETGSADADDADGADAGGADAGGGVLGWGLAPPWTAPIDGLPTDPLAQDDRSPTAEPHPNGVVALDHLVVASPDVERTTAALLEAGITPRRTIVGARGDADVLYRFFLLGTSLLELIGPATAIDAGPARFAGLAFTTASFDALGEVAGPPRPAVQPGRRIATLRREVGSSVPVAFLSPRPGRRREADGG
jgi:hypothetical protein